MITRHAFRDRLRGMTPEDRRAFVASLWEGRGWSVTVDDDGLTAERADPMAERVTVSIVSEPAHEGGVATARRADPFEVVVREETSSSTETTGRRYGSADLYAMLRYGVEYDRRTDLIRTHFGRREDRSGRPRTGQDPPGESTAMGHRSAVSSLIVTVLVGLLLVLPAIAGASPSTSTAAPFEASHLDGRQRLVLQCLPTPVGLSSDALLPQFSRSGTFDRDDWTTVPDPLGATTDRFRGSPLTTPERRSVVTYRGPDGHRYRVEVSRWRTDWLAANAADRAITSTVRVTWEWWSFDVQVIAVTGDAVRSPAAAATALGLLGTVDLNGHGRLDPDCTDEISRL